MMTQISTSARKTMEVAVQQPTALTLQVAEHVPVYLDTWETDLPVQVSHAFTYICRDKLSFKLRDLDKVVAVAWGTNEAAHQIAEIQLILCVTFAIRAVDATPALYIHTVSEKRGLQNKLLSFNRNL